MSRSASVAAFLVTVLVAVPAGWHALDASIQSDGPAIRPPIEEIVVDGAIVKIELDRSLLAKGGMLSASIVATSDVPKEIALDVRALADNGYGEERVQNPPTVVSKQRVKVKATPGGGPPTKVAFQLAAKGKGSLQWYEIDVMSAKTRFVANPDELYGDERKPNDPSYYGEEGEGATAARVTAGVWSGNSFPISITPVGPIPADGAFSVAVTVKNTTRRPIDWMEVDLGARISGGGLDSGLYLDDYGDEVEYTVTEIESEDDDGTLAVGETKTVMYRILPSSEVVKKFTFIAHAHGGGHGALEMASFERPPVVEPGRPSVAKK